MYTLLELERKTFGELKKIGYELNVLPAGDRRCRQSWIDALVNVNPPLLQLLEDSPAASVEQVQEAIEQAAKNSPAVEVEPLQEPLEQAAKTSPGVEVEPVQKVPLESKFGRIVYPKQAAKPIAQNEEARPRLDRTESADIHNLRSLATESNTDSSGARTEALGSQEGDRVLAVARDCETDQGRVLPDQSTKLVNQAQEAIAQAAKTSPGVDSVDDELPGCCNCFGDGYVEDEFGFVKFCQCDTEPKLSHQKTQRAIALAAKNPSGSRSKVSTAHQLLDLFKSSARILHPVENSPGVKTESVVSESAITPAAKTSFNAESDRNPILTGIPLSDRFLARYSPPQPENIRFQSETDGQLSLLNFEVVTEPDPPDPDDFESLDAFREAIARWDLEHPSSFDHCSDLPNSVHSDPLELSLDSFCEWAPCPADWYEPAEVLEPFKVLEPSKVMELSPVHKNSSTSDFFIMTFGRWGDRSKGIDEPPDTGIFARLPKPKPPTFPPQSASWTQVEQARRKLNRQGASWPQVEHKLNRQGASWPQVEHKLNGHPETIPKLFHCVAAGSSTQPARSPPGGDAMS